LKKNSKSEIIWLEKQVRKMANFPEIPGYRIISKLGEGGMAAVYLGIQEKLNRKVAIKILAPSLLKDPTTRARFEREAKTAANLQHSNIIQIVDTGYVGEYYYIIMEYLEESLKDRIKREVKIPPQIALEIIEAIMKALDYAHLKGVYHRDIKPDNIMFRHDNTPVLVDFGIARLYESKEELTRSGQSMGTVHYMSPEQCKGQKDVDSKSDIYSLGAVLFEMLSGRKPYEGELMVSVILMHIQQPVPRLQEELNLFQPLIDKMMAKPRDKRLRSGAEFRQLIDKILINTQDGTPQTVELAPHPVEEPPPSQLLESPPPPDREKSRSFSFRKPKKDIKTLCVEYMESILNILRSIWNYLVQNKRVSGAILVSILIIVFIVLFSQGKESKKREGTVMVGNKGFEIVKQIERAVKQVPSFIEQLLSLLKESIYQEKLKLAKQYFEKGDHKKARTLVTELKKIKKTKELTDLEKKLTRFINSEYNKCFNRALAFFKRKQYYNAKINIIQARQYKTTLELKILEDTVDSHLR
jgi:serine/threonine protein kinase